MSRSNNTEITNPAKRWYEWSGSDGKIKFFDKTKGEKGENVKIDFPLNFLVLDKLHCIRGYNDDAKSGFWSNEIRDINNDVLTIRNKNGIVATGTYKSSPVQSAIGKGAEYCQSVYIAVKEGTDLVICNLQLKGSSIGPWIELCKGKDIYKFAVQITGAAAAKKGSNSYFTPIFKLNPTIAEKSEQQAIALDKELQDFLSTYFKRSNVQGKEAASDAAVASDNIDEVNAMLAGDANHITEPIEDLPF